MVPIPCCKPGPGLGLLVCRGAGGTALVGGGGGAPTDPGGLKGWERDWGWNAATGLNKGGAGWLDDTGGGIKGEGADERWAAELPGIMDGDWLATGLYKDGGWDGFWL